MPKLNSSPVSGSILRMGREGLHRAAEILDARVLERRGVERGTAAPPSHSDSSRSPCITTEVFETLAGCGGTRWPSTPSGRILPKPRWTMRPAFVSSTVVLGRDVAVAIADAGVVEADRRDHAVAVEPVGETTGRRDRCGPSRCGRACRAGPGHDAVDVVDAVVVLLRQRPEAGTPGMVDGPGLFAGNGWRRRTDAELVGEAGADVCVAGWMPTPLRTCCCWNWL